MTLNLENRRIFSPYACLRPPFGGNPLEFGDEIWRRKTRVLGLPDGEKNHDASFLRFDTIAARDGQTDGRCDDYYPR